MINAPGFNTLFNNLLQLIRPEILTLKLFWGKAVAQSEDPGSIVLLNKLRFFLKCMVNFCTLPGHNFNDLLDMLFRSPEVYNTGS